MGRGIVRTLQDYPDRKRRRKALQQVSEQPVVGALQETPDGHGVGDNARGEKHAARKTVVHSRPHIRVHVVLHAGGKARRGVHLYHPLRGA